MFAILHLHPDFEIVGASDNDWQGQKLHNECLINVLAAFMKFC